MRDYRIKTERVLAAMVDFMLYTIIILAVILISHVIIFGDEYFDWLRDTRAHPDAYSSLYVTLPPIISLSIGYIYYCLAPWLSGGYTIGKNLFGIKVVNTKLRKASLWRHSVRAIIIWSHYVTIVYLILFQDDLVSFIILTSNLDRNFQFIYFGSLFLILVTPYGIGIHDIISGTRVVYFAVLPDYYERQREENKKGLLDISKMSMDH